MLPEMTDNGERLRKERDERERAEEMETWERLRAEKSQRR